MALGTRIKSVVLNIVAKDEDAVRKLEHLGELKHKLEKDTRIPLDLEGAETIKLGLDDIGVRIDRVKAKAEEGIHLRADDKEGEAKLDLMKFKLERLSKFIAHPKIDMLGFLRARAEIAALERDMERLTDSHHRIDLSVNGLAWKGWRNLFRRGGGNTLAQDAEAAALAELTGGGNSSKKGALLGGLFGAGGVTLGGVGIAALIAGIVSTGTGLIPAILGGGTAGLGALIAEHFDPKGWKAAFGKGGPVAPFDAMLKGVGKDILPSFIPIIRQVEGFAKTLGPLLDGLFKGAAPIGGAILKGLEGFTRAVLPALTQSFKDLAPSLPLITQSFKILGQAVVDFFKQLGPNGMKAGLEVFIGLLKVLPPLMTAIGFVMDHAGVTIVAAFKAAKAMGVEFWHALRIAGLASWHGIDDAVHGIVAGWDWLKRVAVDTWHGIDTAIHAMENAWSWLWGSIAKIWTGIKSTTTSAWHQLGGVFTGIKSTITRTWNDTWGAVKSTAISAWHQLTGVFDGIKNSVIGVFKSAGHWLWNAGSALIHGLFSGATAAVSAVGGWIGSIGGTIIGAVKHFFGINSPSTVFASIGRFMMDGLLHGMIANSVGLIEKVFGNWPQALAAIIARGFVALKNLPKSLLRDLSHILGPLGGFFSGIFHDLFGHHSGHMQSAAMSQSSAGYVGTNVVMFHVEVKVPPSANADAVAREIQTMLLNLKRHRGGGALGLA